MFDQLETSKICGLSIIPFGTATLTLSHELMVNMNFIQDPSDVVKSTSPNTLSITWMNLYIYHRCDVGYRPLQRMQANRPTDNIGPTYSKSWES